MEKQTIQEKLQEINRQQMYDREKAVIDRLREKGLGPIDSKQNEPKDDKQNDPFDNWHPDQEI